MALLLLEKLQLLHVRSSSNSHAELYSSPVLSRQSFPPGRFRLRLDALREWLLWPRAGRLWPYEEALKLDVEEERLWGAWRERWRRLLSQYKSSWWLCLLLPD